MWAILKQSEKHKSIQIGILNIGTNSPHLMIYKKWPTMMVYGIKTSEKISVGYTDLNTHSSKWAYTECTVPFCTFYNLFLTNITINEIHLCGDTGMGEPKVNLL